MNVLLSLFVLVTLSIGVSASFAQGDSLEPCTTPQMIEVYDLVTSNQIDQKRQLLQALIERTEPAQYRNVTLTVELLINDWQTGVLPSLPECQFAERINHAFYQFTQQRLIASLYVELLFAQLMSGTAGNSDLFIEKIEDYSNASVNWGMIWQLHYRGLQYSNPGS